MQPAATRATGRLAAWGVGNDPAVRRPSQRVTPQRAGERRALTAGGARRAAGSGQWPAGGHGPRCSGRRAERDDLNRRLHLAEELARKKEQLEEQRRDLKRQWRDDVQEHQNLARRAAVIYEEVSRMLFKDFGQLVVDHDLGKLAKTMPFSLFQRGDRGTGISRMQLFCFDLTLAILGAETGRSPGFLVHDSHVFDGAEQRQIGHALHAGDTLSRRYGFQYIVTLNTDVVEAAHRPQGFDLEACIHPVRLNDNRETGGLFGIRFERRVQP